MNIFPKIAMMLILLLGIGLGSAEAGSVAGSPSGDDPFRFRFDEFGHGEISVNGGPLRALNGSLLPDPTQPGKLALTYFLPELVTTGDTRVWEDFTRTHLSDVLRFTNASGKLNGQANGDRMLYYSDTTETESPPAPADTGFPATLVPRDNGGVIEIGPEGRFNLFTFFAQNNQYIGISDVPEPSPLVLACIGALGIFGYCLRHPMPRSAGEPSLHHVRTIGRAKPR